jgi:thymidylate synthase
MVYINRIPDRNDWVYKPEKGYRCDVFFPAHLLQALEKLEKPTCNVVYPRYLEQYSAANKDEHAYLGLLGQLMSRPQTPNRTGIDTHGMFAQQLRFQLYHPLRGAIMPLLTTKKMSYKLVLSELLWFLNGRRCTNTKYLHQFDNKIWDCNTTREFLDSRGLTEARGYQAGDTGPIYGFQWRHWGGDTAERSGDTAERSGDTAERSGDTAERSGDTAATGNAATPPDGIDQLAEVIKTLRTDPYSRRMIVSAWNVAQLGDMALPPCHWSFQFHTEHVVPIYGDVDEPHPDDLLNPYGLVEFHDQIPRKDIRPYMFRLNCCMNMRSADMALGVPFNIASYATLVHIVARIVGMIPGELTINMTDCHLYHNHLEGVREQIERAPYRFPLFRFGPEISAKENLDLDDFTSEDPKFLDQFRILGYHSHPAIKYPMAV